MLFILESKAKLKVLIGLPSPFLGGSERATLETISSLKEQKPEIELHVLIPKNGPVESELKRINIPVHVFPVLWWMGGERKSTYQIVKDILFSFKKALAIKKFLQRERFSCVLTSTVTSPQLAIAAYLARVPHIWYIHEFGKEDHGFKYHLRPGLYYKLINVLSGRVIVNSNIVCNKFKKYISSDKISLIYYGMDVPSKLPTTGTGNRNPFILSIIGRIAPGKRQEHAIRSVKILVNKGYNISLNLVGTENAEYGNFLRQLSRELGLESSICFVPFSNNPVQYFDKSNAILVTSRFEAFGRVTVEAMKMGKPVIMSNTGSGSELIDHGNTGLLYSDVNDLAAQIEFLIINPDQAYTIGMNGYNWAMESCNMEKHGRQVFSVLQSLTM